MAWEPRPAADLPDRLILYDGVCVLCSRMIRFVAARDPEGRWRFVPVQSPYGRRLAERFGIDPEAPQTNAVIRDGRAAFKLDAALAVLDGMPGWGFARLARLLPRPVRNWGYDRIARNRYRLFGRTESCSLPPPGLAARVLTDEPAG
ncbi:thiol-disulfide oxidoreductase DCC family protein [Methylobacterium oryzihabitans]|uniref:DUF393 domain-containing protein n=1 Tax=Methylobacterium oryzihabitans TaxID=2499852 RepID=A0A3S2VVU3_9HYPH|nr:DCC1-like thiol-disulfide oxidoreductase family protein [Methylobacterium oryzihabitans]RVU18799.1 DUF393 domain-containing protein [Methylobacterium oryzihabitans]